MREQISIFDLLNEKPVIKLRVTFCTFSGIRRYVNLELSDPKVILETICRCREENKDLYFQFFEEVK